MGSRKMNQKDVHKQNTKLIATFIFVSPLHGLTCDWHEKTETHTHIELERVYCFGVRSTRGARRTACDVKFDRGTPTMWAVNEIWAPYVSCASTDRALARSEHICTYNAHQNTDVCVSYPLKRSTHGVICKG